MRTTDQAHDENRRWLTEHLLQFHGIEPRHAPSAHIQPLAFLNDLHTAEHARAGHHHGVIG